MNMRHECVDILRRRDRGVFAETVKRGRYQRGEDESCRVVDSCWNKIMKWDKCMDEYIEGKAEWHRWEMEWETFTRTERDSNVQLVKPLITLPRNPTLSFHVNILWTERKWQNQFITANHKPALKRTEELTEIDDIPVQILHHFGHDCDRTRQRFIVQPETAAILDCFSLPSFLSHKPPFCIFISKLIKCEMIHQNEVGAGKMVGGKKSLSTIAHFDIIWNLILEVAMNVFSWDRDYFTQDLCHLMSKSNHQPWQLMKSTRQHHEPW